MLDEHLLSILVCPETHQPVKLATADLVASVNAAIAGGKVKNREGAAVSESIQALLVRQDGTLGYPVRDDIPIMLIGEALPLESLS
ncbi:MAG: hypothetical protein U0821_05885 [Chloroflexota bacterium]